MLILAIDTFDVVTGAALIRDGELLAERNLTRSKNRDAVLTEMVAGIMRDCDFEFAGLDCLAVSSGPGSFTGLRVGTAYAKGICFASDKPLVAVNSLEALAHTAGFTDKLIIPVIHARAKEVYYAGYLREKTGLKQVWQSDLCSVETLAAKIDQPAVLTGSGCRKHGKELIINSGEVEVSALRPESTAGYIGLLGLEKFKKGLLENLKSFEPEYLQDFPR
ncbi:MAG: tRNA (adenosine(37)-N6)-threonylcarbamoyltransferase complex dimerization subunit type 1 TsaB [FCB group bacterium]|nr:tRNA (adenosine(37)-N6)-threonylcarbamoyltransferase complex dimerization subunit type 1 TsaB [FCB group bacterium]